jgi:hypothetical protein
MDMETTTTRYSQRWGIADELYIQNREGPKRRGAYAGLVNQTLADLYKYDYDVNGVLEELQKIPRVHSRTRKRKDSGSLMWEVIGERF